VISSLTIVFIAEVSPMSCPDIDRDVTTMSAAATAIATNTIERIVIFAAPQRLDPALQKEI